MFFEVCQLSSLKHILNLFFCCFCSKDETEKKAAEKKFMDIASAKEVLTDDGKFFKLMNFLLKWLNLLFGINLKKVMLD